MISITINGREIQTEKDTPLLQLARSKGIGIPSLCFHQALLPYGACRLCVVEVTRGARTTIVNSCAYPVREEGISVETNTPQLRKIRKIIMELLLARCPEVEIIQKMAAGLGVKERRLPGKTDTASNTGRNNGNENCILCGLCVRVCREVIGKEAISFARRGAEREVATPFYAHSGDCVGCTACAFVCPTGAVKVEDRRGGIFISPWNTEISYTACVMCGVPVGPEAAGRYLKDKLSTLNLPADWLQLCPGCRRKEIAGKEGKYSFIKHKGEVDYG